MTADPRAVRLLGLSGSLRAASTNSQLVRAAARVTGPRVSLTLFEGLGGLPHFNPDLDGDGPPEPVLALRARVAAADGLFISSPEYAHGVPGALKNALDWLVSGVEIVGMPVAVVNASPRAVHAQAALEEILTTMSATLVAAASGRIPLVGKGWDVVRILAEPGVEPLLRASVAALAEAGTEARAERRRLVSWSGHSGGMGRHDGSGMIDGAHFILYVRDQAAAAQFYAHALGLEPRLDVPGMTEFELAGGAVLGLMPEQGIARLLGPVLGDPSAGSGLPRAELYLRVDDPDAGYRRALAAGARALSPLASRDWGDDAAYCQDLDGHLLAFARRTPKPGGPA